jgi:hypothetical protein
MLSLSPLAGAPAAPADDGPAVANGPWGGLGVSLSVSDSGAEVEFDCAHGTIRGPLRLDAEGRFDLPGVFVRERPGPVREGAPGGAEEPARYRGRAHGDTLTLEAFLPGPGRTVGPYTLERGAAPRLRKCG